MQTCRRNTIRRHFPTLLPWKRQDGVCWRPHQVRKHSLVLLGEASRRIKLNNRIEILERRIQEEDSAEVNEMVRTAKVTPEQLAALLRQSAATTPNPAALSAVGATFEKEVGADED